MLGLKDDELARIVRSLYGLTGSGEYWHETLIKHNLKDLEMNISVGDFAMFLRSIAGMLVALFGSYVDDVLHAAKATEKVKMKHITSKKFEI